MKISNSQLRLLFARIKDISSQPEATREAIKEKLCIQSFSNLDDLEFDCVMEILDALQTKLKK